MIREALTLERLRALGPEEAAAYFVARRAEGLTASEEEMLAAWLAEDEAHARELRRIERAWDWLADPGEHEVIGAMRAHAVAPQRRHWLWSRPAAAAAAILLLVGALAMLVRVPGWPSGSGGTQRGDERLLAYVSAPGQVRIVTLPDGSRMTLDAGSRVLGRFSGDRRSAELVRGRAMFAVSADRSRPFTVTARERRITALGTRFDVGIAGGALTVNLFEGRVAVGPVDATVEPFTLRPGQQLIERDGRAIVRTIGARIEDQAGWTRGLLHFDDVTLSQAAEQVNLYSRDKIVIRDSEVAGMRISGEFKAGDAMRFALAVAELRRLRVVRRAQQIELLPAR